MDWECKTASPITPERRPSEISVDLHTITETSPLRDAARPHSSDHHIPLHQPDCSTLDGYPPHPLVLTPEDHSSISAVSPVYSRSSHASLGSRDLIPQVGNGLPNLDEHEACLMRYFVVQLAPWVSLQAIILSERYTDRFSLTYVMGRDILHAQFHCELEHVHLYSTPSIQHQQDTSVESRNTTTGIKSTMAVKSYLTSHQRLPSTTTTSVLRILYLYRTIPVKPRMRIC